MVYRPYHSYSTSALRELSKDLSSSQAQLGDQRADYVMQAGLDQDDLHRFDVLVNRLGDQIAAIDQESITRQQGSTTIPPTGHRGARGRPGRTRRPDPRVMQANPKPHCRAKILPAEMRRPR